MNRELKAPKKLALLAILTILSSSEVLAAKIKIGVVLPSSGSTATFGIENANGIKLAHKKLMSEKKAIDGLELVFEDDKSESVEATNAIRKLINIDKVSMVIGEVTSSNTLAMAPIAEEAKIPLFSPAATNAKVTQNKKFVSRACFTDDFQGVVMARFAFNQLNANEAVIVVDNSQDYSKGLAESFKKEYLKLGGKLLSDDLFYMRKDMDFSSLLRRVKRLNPKAVFLPGYYEEVGLMIKQARQLGINVPFLGGDGWDSPDLFKIAGPAIKGNYISSHFAPDDTDPLVQNFVRDYEKAYGQKPGAMAALGYDAYLIAIEAIKKSKTKSAQEINTHLLATKDFMGVTGKISIDAERNSKKAAVVLEATDKGFIFKNKVQP